MIMIVRTAELSTMTQELIGKPSDCSLALRQPRLIFIKFLETQRSQPCFAKDILHSGTVILVLALLFVHDLVFRKVSWRHGLLESIADANERLDVVRR